MPAPIAVVAAACEFPEASTPQALWQGVLHGRQSFRRFPPERLALADYFLGDDDPDSIYPIEAALIEGYAFDRHRFVVPQSSYLATDIAHWLALDVADRALAALPAGWAEDQALKDRIAVIVANTLTGEFSRANLLRYRWPYVQRQARAAALAHLAAADTAAFIDEFEKLFKAPFPPPDEDSLAGGLSNTIAGRIANHFGLRGGAHAVDGACASSLVAVISACEKLCAGDVDAVVVGAVDLSLDPFELVGFARNGALARGEMRVFDRESNGFWPGEGCGCLVLATQELVRRREWPVLGWIRGTGMSTDGQGGLTRPTVGGQLLALHRAWRAAGLDPGCADYFEAHGTGTPTGDPVELAALAQLLDGRRAGSRAAPVGSIKANIGHTKAAAGMAGLLKALAIGNERIVPAITGCPNPHPIFEQAQPALRVAAAAERIDHRRAVVVGVNSFGFGGVNCHVVVQGPDGTGRTAALPLVFEGGLRGELIAVHAASRSDLAARLLHIRNLSATLARSQLADMAAACRPEMAPGSCWRACLIASSPQELQAACAALLESLAKGNATRAIEPRWAWSAPSSTPPALAFMFPGQGLALAPREQAWAERFAFIADAGARIAAAAAGGAMDTATIQPLLAEISIASLALLERFGVTPAVVLGHSFGELSALYAAGVFDAAQFRRLAGLRGRLMQDLAVPAAMLAIEAARDRAGALAATHGVDVAAHNGAQRHVLAGPVAAIVALEAECRRSGIGAARLPADRAFHSRLMADAQRRFGAELAALPASTFARPTLPVVSTITGAELHTEPLPALLAEQFTLPVRFAEAVDAINRAGTVELIIEVGASAGLGPLVAALDGPPCMPVSTFGASLEPLLAALGAAWVCGSAIDTGVLYAGRLIRPYSLDAVALFLPSPCGAAPAAPQPTQRIEPLGLPVAVRGGSGSAFDLLQATICELAGLPRTHVTADSRLLADLHLNSIRARHAVASAARQLGIATLPFNPAEMAKATVGAMARQLEQLRGAGVAGIAPSGDVPAGIEPWIRVFRQRWAAAEDDAAQGDSAWRCRLRIEDSLAPLAAELRQAAAQLFGIDDDAAAPPLLVLPGCADAEVLERLLAVTRAVAASDAAPGLLVLQGAQLANSFLRSVAAERADQRYCAVEFETLDTDALARGVREFCRQRRGYSEIRLRGGVAERRQIEPHRLARRLDSWTLGPGDVVLVTGGAKGIGAAAAQFFGATYHCRLALVGRSTAQHGDVQASLAMLNASGLQAIYIQADLTDPRAAARAVAAIQSHRGGGVIAAIVHAAGINQPCAVAQLESAQALATLAAKVGSLANVLQALRPGQLRLLVGFGSIIGEIGLPGEAHYALANEWLVDSIRAHSKASPSTRCIPICWSAWRETGMAARLDGVLDDLARSGTRALGTAEALRMLREVIESPDDGQALIVSGRWGRVPDPVAELPALHRHRFLERPRVFYPGIELVADAEVSTDRDPYLLDHAPYGLPVFPLVAAIEAMWSAALCLQGGAAPPVFEDLRIGDAITCTPGQSLGLRTSALVLADGSVRASIRCSATEYAVDHFSALIHWNRGSDLALQCAAGSDRFAAERVLYRGLVFHGPRFRRLKEYHRIGARGCLASTVAGAAQPAWYARLLPRLLAGGDPAVRDSVLHALQACIPQHPVLPVGAARVELGVLQGAMSYSVRARQTAGDGREFTFDIDICGPAGEPVERWFGLRVARVISDQGDLGLRREIDLSLVPAFVGRLLLDTLGQADWQVGVAATSALAIKCALGPQAELAHRIDGAPLAAGHRVSISHGAGLTLVVAHRLENIACDIQALPNPAAAAADPDWRLMLGEQRWVFARDLCGCCGLTAESAGLVTWSATECLAKLGRDDWPFETRAARCIDAPHTGAVVELHGQGVSVAVGLVRIAGQDVQTAIAVAVTTPAGEPQRESAVRAAELQASP